MLSLIILFISAVFCLFLAFTKKPALVLLAALSGLVGTAWSMLYSYNTESDFLSKYEGVSFDDSALIFSMGAIIFTGLILLSAYSSFKENLEHTGDYMAMMLFSLFGAICMTSFTDMFMFFLGLEVLSIPIYVLVGSKKSDPLSSESSLKYFMTGSFVTGILLFGMAWVYGATGSFKIAEIAQYIHETENVSSLVYVGMLLMMAAFLFKIGAAPFHFWSPDVYDGSPSPITGFMATVVKFGAFGAFLKMFSVVFIDLKDFWEPALAFLAILTMFVGNLSAIRQVRFKRLLAYSSIAHIGYTLLTILTLKPDSNFDAWFYLMAYGFSTVALITVLLIVKDKEDKIEALKGLARKNPLVGFVAILALLSLAGVPPLMGFIGKYMVFASAISTHFWLVAVALLNSGIGIYYYLKTIFVILQKDEEATGKYPVTMLQSIVLMVCALFLLFGGFLAM